MTRLTTILKNQIIHAAVEKSGMKARITELELHCSDIADDITREFWGDDYTEALEALKVLSKNPFGYGVHAYSSSQCIEVGGVEYIVTVPTSIGATQRLRTSGNTKAKVTLVRGQELVDWYGRLDAAYSALAELRKTLLSTIDPIKTVKELLQVWPEAKELLPDNLNAQKKSLPMVQNVSELNQLLGLPSHA